MATLALEDEFKRAARAALPTPAGTPYRTPSRGSRKSRRSLTPPTSDRFEKKNAGRLSREFAVEGDMSFFDPRRFTPTLHANLVSEILTLRRDQEDKLKIIERLETLLFESQGEKDALQASLSDTTKETRSLKRQLSFIEGGTSSALSELTREREEATEATAETKRRLEAAQKKVRAQEEDSQRVHDLWTKERESWEEERRKFERKLHVAETRLGVVLEVVDNFQAAASKNDQETGNDTEVNDNCSVRTQSRTNSIRFSTLSGPGVGQASGFSLADELNFDDDDDDYQTDPDGRQSVLSSPKHYRNLSRDSIVSGTHQRNYSIDSLFRPGSVARGRLYMNPGVLGKLEGGIREDDEITVSPQAPEYMDAAVQYSPPPSPKLNPLEPAVLELEMNIESDSDLTSLQPDKMETEANQPWKRVRVSRLDSIDTPKIITHPMVSSGSQTANLPSPPATPLFPAEGLVSDLKSIIAETTSIATQTEVTPTRKPLAPLPIPSISIVPPSSPPTPREHQLPVHVKDVGCQVTILQPSHSVQSVAVQTDEIRVDKRLDRLPRHLHPSSVTSRPSSPTSAANADDNALSSVPENLPVRNPRRLTSKHSFMTELNTVPLLNLTVAEPAVHDAYPGGNDNGPLSAYIAPMRRPHRVSSLFAGFDAASSDDGDEFKDASDSDAEYRTALSAPKPTNGSTREGKRTSTSTVSMSPDNVRISTGNARVWTKQIGSPDIYNSFSLADAHDVSVRKEASRPPTVGMSSGSRAGVMRRNVMIQNGIQSHQARSPSPGLSDIQEPPFPIPTRASSRQPVFTVSAPSEASRSPSRYGSGRHRRGSSRSTRSNIYRNNSVRKVRSAATVPRGGRQRRQSSHSPPPMTPSEEPPSSPQLPPLPNNLITTPRNRNGGSSRYAGHKSLPSTANTADSENSHAFSVGSSQQSSGVVGAIAQTMVGEWMFKYVRRRRSFGVADGGGREENSNDRHKRWVWLAPYERAILWSSKQPQSGTALMGKSGRKLTIQSVLDVKDDNPVPRGEAQIFNRSILILTPQRALKFTATSSERHYLWLMALSFLAHSQQAVPEITPSLAPPKAAPAPDPELSKSKLKRGGIRDSIRLTKGRNPSFMARNEQDIPPVPQDHGEPVPTFPVHIDTEELASIPTHHREPSSDAAEPPMIPRFHGRAQGRAGGRAKPIVNHGRRRSSTGGHVPPPLSFRGFTPPASSIRESIAGVSIDTAGSSDMYGNSELSSKMTWGMSAAGSQYASETPVPTGNFFEAIGTVRMEAFISPHAASLDNHSVENKEARFRARRQSKERRRHRSRSRSHSKQRDIYTSRGGRHTRGVDSFSSRGGFDEELFHDDPFRGF